MELVTFSQVCERGIVGPSRYVQHHLDEMQALARWNGVTGEHLLGSISASMKDDCVAREVRAVDLCISQRDLFG